METPIPLRVPANPPVPLGQYAAVVVRNGFGSVSGQLPIHEGKRVFRGRVGAELTLPQAREAATLCALNVVGQLRRALGENLERASLLRVDGYVASAPGFTDQPAVLDAASETLVRLLGPRGEHTRAALGVATLPGDAPVELVVTFLLL